MVDQKVDSVNIVIDIGSSSIRVIAFSLQGKGIAAFKQNYDTFYPYTGWAEQNPHDWEQATLNALSEMMQFLPKEVHINGLSCTGQCPTYVPVNAELDPLGNALTYQDNRSLPESDAIIALFGNEYIHSHSGHSVEPFFILPKLLWHKNHAPKIYKKIFQVLQPCDYLEYFLTGNVFTDPAYACGTLAYDLTTGGWNEKVLQGLGIDPAVFPAHIIHAWDQVGVVKDEIAHATGLPKGLQVIRGGPDSQCCSLGVAAIETDVLSNMSGTSTCLNRTLLQPIQDLRVGNYAHVIPERWSAEVGLNTTGVSLKKIAGILFSELDEKQLYRQVHAILGRSPAGSNDLLYFPYLSNGERDNPEVKGGFYNFSMMTAKEDMLRAVLEGVAFAEKERADLMVSSNEKFSSMRISGGGASSADWCQIKADVMNMPVYALKEVDAAELGASMIISVGTGIASDFTAAVKQCDLQFEEFLPQTEFVGLYAERYAAFRAYENKLS